MKEEILILSDIHGGVRRAKEAAAAHKNCTTLLFLGDGLRHLDALRAAAPNMAIAAVKGNCDTFLDGDAPNECTLEIGGHRIFLCHGHTRMVKFGLGGLISAAKAARADIALFGHTHIAHEEYDAESGIYLFNPGSIGETRDGRYTYGILTIDGENLLFSVGEIQ